MIEYFDVVDLHDKPTGEKVTKAEAHAAGIVHRYVAVYVFGQDGQLYLQHHKRSGRFDHTVGGHVSVGEDYLSAAQREAEEEIGMKGQDLKEVCTSIPSNELFNPKVQTSRQFHMLGIFESTPDQNWSFVPNMEVEQLSARSIEEVVADMQVNPSLYTPGFINTMDKYLEVRRPDINFEAEICRKNWGSL